METEVKESAIETALAEYKLPEKLADLIKSQLMPLERQTFEWHQKALEIVVNDPSETHKIDEAKRVLGNVMTIEKSIEALHKELKADSRRVGDALDLIKRTLLGYLEPTKTHLKAQRDYAKIQEAKRKEALVKTRMEQLSPYRLEGDRLEEFPLGDMTEAAFETMFTSVKARFEQRQAEKEELARMRAKQEQDAAEERERIRQQQEKLQAENERQQRIQNRINALMALGFTWDQQNQSYVHVYQGMNIGLVEVQTMPAAEFQEIYKRFHGLVLEYKAELDRKEKERQAELARERAEREKLEREKADREKREELERKEKEAERRRMERAPDREKLLSFANQIELIEPIELADPDANEVYQTAVASLAKIVSFIRHGANNL